MECGLYEELPGTVLTEALDIDLEFEAPIYNPSDVESSSESESDHGSDVAIMSDGHRQPKSMKNHILNRGTIRTSWEHREWNFIQHIIFSLESYTNKIVDCDKLNYTFKLCLYY